MKEPKKYYCYTCGKEIGEDVFYKLPEYYEKQGQQYTKVKEIHGWEVSIVNVTPSSVITTWGTNINLCENCKEELVNTLEEKHNAIKHN